MSLEREVLRVGSLNKPTQSMDDVKAEMKEISDAIDPPEVKEALSRAERKKRMARVLERGLVGERLMVELPPHLHGEWAPIRLIDYYKSLGFEIDNQFARNRSLHSRPELGGQECAVVGDAVYMVQSVEDFEIWEELRSDRYFQMNNKPARDGETSNQIEERAFKDSAKTLDEGASTVPVVDNSKAREARKEQLAAATAAAQQRTMAAREAQS